VRALFNCSEYFSGVKGVACNVDSSSYLENNRLIRGDFVYPVFRPSPMYVASVPNEAYTLRHGFSYLLYEKPHIRQY
jgi:hypothetical protein